jgi:signal transduction histidine kinase
VQDDGIGFDDSVPHVARHGLIGMRYRVEAEGGEMRLRSKPGEGTSIEATLPSVPQADAADEEPAGHEAAA